MPDVPEEVPTTDPAGEHVTTPVEDTLSEADARKVPGQVQDTALADDGTEAMATRVISFIEHVSQGAEKSIRHIRWLFAVSAVVTVVALYYFIGVRGWHWVWAVLPIMLMALPVNVLLIGERMLASVAALPAKAVGMGRAIAEVSREYWPEIREFEARDLKGLVKWRSYILLAKVLWKARSIREDGTGLFAGLLKITLVCNPVFWVVMFGAIVLLVAECGVLVLACLGFMLFA